MKGNRRGRSKTFQRPQDRGFRACTVKIVGIVPRGQVVDLRFRFFDPRLRFFFPAFCGVVQFVIELIQPSCFFTQLVLLWERPLSLLICVLQFAFQRRNPCFVGFQPLGNAL